MTRDDDTKDKQLPDKLIRGLASERVPPIAEGRCLPGYAVACNLIHNLSTSQSLRVAEDHFNDFAVTSKGELKCLKKGGI